MIDNSRSIWVIFLATVVARLVFLIYTGFITDDAFITFRYAENLGNGFGFVYNSGERVLGTSTPLFTLILSLFALLRLDLQLTAAVLSALAAGVTGVIIHRLAAEHGLGRFAWIPALIYILWPRSLAAESCGMETALFTLLVTGSFLLLRTKRYSYSLILASLAILCRPEGLLLAGIMFTSVLVVTRMSELKRFVIPALLILLWSVFSLGYFGTIVPNSIPAKLALYGSISGESLLDRLVYLFALQTPFGWISTLLTLLGIGILSFSRRLPLPETAWVFVMLLFLATINSHLFFWYIAPIYPVYLILMTVPLAKALDAISWPRRLERLTTMLAGSALAVLLAIGSLSAARSYRAQQEILDRVHREIGIYLGLAVNSEDWVAAEDIGYIGYYSRTRILDRDGLVSPRAIAYNKSGRYLQLIEDADPQWVVANVSSPISDFLESAWFVEHYVLEKSFREANVEYTVFSRNSDGGAETQRPTQKIVD